MIVGVPKEVKPDEYRVSLLPYGVEILTSLGHRVLVESMAGVGSGIEDEAYARCGAEVFIQAKDIFEQSDLIVKVKEPLPEEVTLLRPGQMLFTFLHLAANRQLTEALLKQKVTAFAYETLQLEHGELPCLTPMSEVAGRMAVHEGAKYLEEPMHGRGILLGGVPGVSPAEVVILGAGVVGSNACKMAAGLGARVSVLDVNLNRLRFLDEIMPPNVRTIMSHPHSIQESLCEADLVISSVLQRGAKAPCLVDRSLISKMKSGAVIVDVSIDQGGSLATSQPTTHAKPTYIVDDVVHYCVTNMPGAVAKTSTYALTNATWPFILDLAQLGCREALKNAHFRSALNCYAGHLVIVEVAEAFEMKHLSIKDVSELKGKA